MRQNIFQGNTQVATKEELETINAVLSPKMDLERFLDENFLKPEGADEISAVTKGCSNQRGSTGHAWQK